MPLPFPVAIDTHLFVRCAFLASVTPGTLDFHDPTPVTSMRCAFGRTRRLRPALNWSREEDFAFDFLLRWKGYVFGAPALALIWLFAG
jgi:hypothetical protein